jgi:hypothetical protein
VPVEILFGPDLKSCCIPFLYSILAYELAENLASNFCVVLTGAEKAVPLSKEQQQLVDVKMEADVANGEEVSGEAAAIDDNVALDKLVNEIVQRHSKVPGPKRNEPSLPCKGMRVLKEKPIVRSTVESTVFLRNLPLDATQRDIERKLQDYGELKSCR